MEFCSKCGSYMKKTEDGFLCPRCGNEIHSNVRIQSKHTKRTDHPSPIYVVNNLQEDHEKVSQTCPKCGNKEALHWLSVISGEHAGVGRERTVEHFRCTKCAHS